MANDQDTFHADLCELLTILGMGDHSRPQSPHEVFQEALGVLRERLSLPAPTPTSPCLGEREAVARTDEACSCCGLTIEECSERYMLGIEAKEALQADADLWPVLKANFHLMHAKAFEQGYLAGRAKFDPLRTENETLRAERDAAIARAEEAERKIQLYRQIAPERIAEMVEEYGAYNATCKLGKVYGTATIGEFVSALLATAKLAQAEGEIATMRAALKLAENPLSHRNANGHGAPGSNAVATALAAVRAALSPTENADA